MLTTQSDILEFFEIATPLSARAVKLYFCSEHRNEWINYQGETQKIKRPWGVVFPTVDLATAAVERARTAGSGYSIQQSVALEIRFSTGIVLVKEAFANEPLKRMASLKPEREMSLIKSVFSKNWLSTSKEEFLSISGYRLKEAPRFRDFDPDVVCYERRSSPGGSRKNSLAWSLKPVIIYPAAINHIVKAINAVIAASNTATISLAPSVIAPEREPILVVEAPAQVDEPEVVVAVVVESTDPVIAESAAPNADSDGVETTREQVSMARVGQGLYRRRLGSIEHCCRLTLVGDKEHLRASHIKPWRDATDEERLDGNNGLLLSPHVDYLFDHGFISFTDNGELLISPTLNKTVLTQWGIRDNNVGSFNPQQQTYLAYHRANIFRASKP